MFEKISENLNFEISKNDNFLVFKLLKIFDKFDKTFWHFEIS